MRWGAVVLLALLGAARAEAQSRVAAADLTGTVSDVSGAALAGAEVTVTSLGTQVTRTVVPAADGRWWAPALAPARYRVTATHTGFTPIGEEVTLRLGETARLDLRLPLAGRAEAVTVEGEAALPEPHRTALHAGIGRDEIEHLPIDRRNFLSFALLTPGVTTDRTPQQGSAATSGLSFLGQRARGNNVMVDGFDDNDLVSGGVLGTFSQDAVQEFQVIAASYPAEIGRASAGVVDTVTRSGTNELHGGAFFFLRDEALNAADHFVALTAAGTPVDAGKAPFDQRQWGATLGGPVQRERTFFFLAFERFASHASNFVAIDPATAAVFEAAGFPVELGYVPYDVRTTSALARLDHHWSGTQHTMLRATWSSALDENVEPWGGLVAKSRGAALDRDTRSLALAHTAVLGTRGVNETRLQVALDDRVVYSLDPTCGGPCVGVDQGGPEVQIPGVASVGRQRLTPLSRRGWRVQVADTLSLTWGAHLLKAGFDANTLRETETVPATFGGRYLFAPLAAAPGVTGPVSAVQALALGLPVVYGQGYGNPADSYDYEDVSLFLQDEWRPWPQLTVRAGLRYQHQVWPDDVRFDVPVPGGSVFSYPFPRGAHDLAPRLALAWDLGTTSVHAAWGLFYGLHNTGLSTLTDVLGTPDGVRSVLTRFPDTIAAWRAPGHRLPQPATSGPAQMLVMTPDLDSQRTQQLTAGVDHAIGTHTTVSADLVWARGRGFVGGIDYNPIVPALGPGRRPNDVEGRAGTSASVLQETSFGESWYRGLTIGATSRIGQVAELRASYTLSEAEDTSTDVPPFFLPQDNGRGRDPANPAGLPVGFDPDAERGPATHDQRHRLVISGSAVLPWDVRLAAIVTVASGRPYTALAGVDLNGDGDGGAPPTDRARRVPADASTSVERNGETMDGQRTVDLRLSKTIRLRDTLSLELTAECFNLLDRTNVTEVDNVFGRGAYPAEPLPTFGRTLQAGPPRQVQIGARLAF